MEYLHILKIGKNRPPSRVEVAVIGRETIYGVECFFHSERGKFCVSHLASGGLIASSFIRGEAIALAEHRLCNPEKWAAKLKEVEAHILGLGVIYPINPVPA